MIASFLLAVSTFQIFSASALATKHGPYSTWMLDSIISRGEGIEAADGLLSEIQKEALRAAIQQSNNGSQKARWTDYYQRSLSYNISEFSNPVADSMAPLDRLCAGTSIMQTKLETEVYTSVVEALRKSLDLQETNANGGWWYFPVPPPPLLPYKNLSFSDGMYGVAPFVTLYGQQHPSDTAINIGTALRQLEALYTHVKYKGNLLLHGYDASKTAPWSNPVTGASPIVWGRSMSWYMIGLLDALEIAAKESSTLHTYEYRRMRTIFRKLAHGNIDALWKSAQKTSKYGVWQVVDMPGKQGNFIEASASAMMAYVLAKGMRLDYIDPLYRPDTKSPSHVSIRRSTVPSPQPKSSCFAKDIVQSLYDQVVRSFAVPTDGGKLEFHGTSALASLQVSNPNYEYYISRPTTNNSLIGESAFVLASLENELARKMYQS